MSAIALIKKCAGQVKHRKNAKEGECAIVFGTSDKWKRKPRSDGKRAKSEIVFVNKKIEPWFHPTSGSACVVVVLAEAMPLSQWEPPKVVTVVTPKSSCELSHVV
ncbi:hypothetical protein PC129_g22611 [Phytophthora cactorum]|uniref:Uncharacterized protein n=1 Tax=Phytophthora cactorum TaxID=29920 RepID=A0A329RZK6_9STRA|nr:hypothetical protein Pcac1_g18713 [Phytophthora cactorum]KAG2802547.1 hypothetical protein PC112_g19591 [Phytophthora cactorum]KAG2803375.1 hypothetical protein PC111_g18715 [Phytophthora cactorum]KAG2839400.1 hypothetical protein PC113_g19481 [Phytophthora cactorum]KAG2881929.1 hypothetical protein PC114_g21307 [Phytophthora cactorum]